MDASPIARRIYVQPSSGELVVHSTQDVNDTLAFNKSLFNATRSSSKLWNNREWVLVARIPLILVEQWMERGLNFFDYDDFKIITRLLNDSDYSHLRTSPGRI